MTEETTTTEETQSTEGTQTEEGNNGNDQEQAAKRLAEKNKKKDESIKNLEAQLEAAKKGETATVEKPVIDPDMLAAAKTALSEQYETDGKVNEVFTKWPEFKEHEKKIREFLADDTRKGIPIEEVIAGAIGPEALMRMGATMDAERLQVSKKSEAGGGNAQTKVLSAQEKKEKSFMDSLPDGFK